MNAVIDACAFHEWDSFLALTPYMEPAWAQLIARPDQPGGALRVGSQWLYRNPRGGNKRADAYPEKGIPGSDRELLKAQLSNRPSGTRTVLGYDEGILTTGFPHHYVARAAVRAANDWTIERWLDEDDGYFGLALIQTALPDDAAYEIRRVGAHDRIVGIAMGANGLAKPFGNPVYRPIHEAAAELSLPLVLQVGGDAMTDQIAPPMAGGLASTYAEYRVLAAHPIMSHVASFITEGVFDRFPDLKLLLVGCGAAWLPGFLWRMDYFYKTITSEAPWMKRLPSEYFVDHVRVATYGLEWPHSPHAMIKLLSTLPGAEKLLVYASGYPNYDSEQPDAVVAKLPEPWHQNVMYTNAAHLFRWSTPLVED